MKTFLIFLLLTSFIGCSQKNAFDKFELTPIEELSEDSIQSSKLKDANKRVDGVVTVIYLNQILPKEYNEDEYFYVYFYKKSKKNSISFILNNKKPLSIEKLPTKNRFTYLTSFEAPWSTYYLVKFKKQGDLLKFIVKDGPFSSDILSYEKDQ